MKKIFAIVVITVCFALVAGATDIPKMEAFLGYSFVRLSSNGDLIPSRDLNGGSGQFVYNFSKGFGVAFDAGAVTNNSGISDFNVDTTVAHLVVGPRYKFNRHSKFQPYLQALFGGAYTTASKQIFAVPVGSPLIAVDPTAIIATDAVSARLVASRRSFAMLVGGGLDWKVSKHMQVRPLAFDYFMVQPESVITGQTRERNNWRYSAGLNFTFGAQ
uniref:Outer membrane protein beta-barrel domain-containing protein n=1 Tax=Solibacter usitatus (strain Ellin6076) TaxID=234267 RepID=Q021V7_SOLUE